MKNKLKFIIFILKSFLLLSTNVSGVEQFNFDITEVEITEKGNVFSGYKRGTITVDNGIKIEADEFNYDKISNILKTKGKVKVLDEINEYVIYSDEIIYLKNEEKIFTYGNSKAINLNTKITAVEFEYDKNQNIIKAKKKVKIEDEKDDIIILAEEIVYKKNIENIFARGNAEAKIQR